MILTLVVLAVKRLMREAQELAEPTYDYFAQPLSDNLFEWHFTVRGPADTEFDGGIYHGRIVLPPDYPMKPPNIIVLTVIMQLMTIKWFQTQINVPRTCFNLNSPST